ncbi:MAG: 2-C-methyl-D-erythritol 2,4-cyclodiphosphate synthase [Oscillospiraceae bacterium]|nr:2-C-methyl-D-erythritol 2,4-cyclodiphosphate synthase [Oscillospiraceae bacterium]
MPYTGLRVGHGYDVHRLTEGRALILGGVQIPYEKGLLGHSDADVIVHAIMDSLLGAAGLWDIGHAFPDDDPETEGISSLVLLERVRDMLREKGYQVVNLDGTIIAQRPKLSPYIPAMREQIARVLEIDPDQINLKATTEEKLGFTGAGEGIAAHAVSLIEKR